MADIKIDLPWAKRVNTLRKNSFDVKNGWLISVEETAKGTKEKKVANIVPWPTKQMIMYDGMKEERYIYIRGRLANNSNNYPEKRLTFDELNGNLKTILPKLWGPEIIVKNNDSVSEAIKILCHDLPTTRIYQYTGWQKVDNKWVFLHAGGALGASNVKVELTTSEPKLQYYTLPNQCQDRQKAAEAAFSFFDIANPEISFPLFSMAFYAPLCEILPPHYYPNFIPFLVGLSGHGKSTIAALILCFFGNFDTKSFPAQYQDTPASIEQKCFILKDVLMVVDDYYPSKTPEERKNQRAVASKLSRLYGDGASKSRSSATGKLQATYLPRGAVIGTGESKPEIADSGLKRHLFVDVTQERVYIKEVDILLSQKHLLTEFMVLYLSWLSNNWGRIPGMFDEPYRDALEHYTRNIRVGRIKDATAKLCAVLDIVLVFAHESELLTEEQCSAFLNKGVSAIVSVGEKNDKMYAPDNPVEQFLNALYDVVDSGRANLCEVGSDEVPENHIGYYDDDLVYLYCRPTVKAVKDYLMEINEQPSFNERIWTILNREGIIITSPGRVEHPNTVQKPFKGESEEFIQMRRPANGENPPTAPELSCT